MAQTISVVDPWSGMYKGVETLRQAASAADERKLNELKMAQAKLQLDEAQRAAQDKQAQRELARRLATERKDVTTPGYNSLADVQAYNDAVRQSNVGLPVVWQDQATAPVPAGGQGINLPSLNPPMPQGPATGLGSLNAPATAPGGPYGVFDRNMAEKQAEQDRLDALNEKAIAAQQASGLKTANAQTTQVPLSTLEKAQRMADLQMQQGDLAGGLATMKAGIDITTQIPAATQKITSDIMRQGYNLIAAGKSADEAKAAMVDYAKRTYPPDLIPGIENIQFTPGGVGIIKAPGGVITTEYDTATGGTKFSYHKVDDHTMTGGLDVLAAKNRAAALMKANPNLTQNEAMAQAADEIRKENNQAKQSNIMLRINAGAGQKSATGETGLRKEFNALQEVKNYKTFSGQYATMAATMGKIKDFKSLNPADQVLIMDFNKALDPSSVVRESEYARTPANMSVLNRAYAATSRLMQGGVLNQTERQALMQAATVMKQSYKSQYDAARAQYQRIAEENGYRARNVVPTLEQTGDAPTGGKTVTRTGTTKDGRKVIEYSDGTRVIQ